MESTIPDRDVFTTGQVARICHCAPRTVSKWFDHGLLRGYRLPASQDRRIPRADLLAFLRENHMLLEDHAPHTLFYRLLCLSDDPGFVERVALGLPADEWKVKTAPSQFAFGAAFTAFRPGLLLLDHATGRAECRLVAVRLREEFPALRVVGLLNEDEGDGPGPYHAAVQRPTHPGIVASALLGVALPRAGSGRRKEAS